MQYTENLSLKKPQSTDTALISDINDNMDSLDAAVPRIFTSQTASSWVSDATYSDYAYRCALTLSGVTASDTASVVFALAQSTSGNYAPVCETYAGGVYIYSKVNTSITVPVIVVMGGSS